jgi:hypothetical protein
MHPTRTMKAGSCPLANVSEKVVFDLKLINSAEIGSLELHISTCRERPDLVCGLDNK